MLWLSASALSAIAPPGGGGGAGFDSGSAGQLRVTELQVPTRVALAAGVGADLRCRWELPAGAALYSAKWYKDGEEFLRFMPDDSPPLLAFPVGGIRLQAGVVSAEAVSLRDLTVASGGLYRCEVSTEGPAFRTAYAQQRMQILTPPPGEPRVTGVREAYARGDVVEANCTAGRSHPPPQITWYINGIKAERWFPGRAPEPLDDADAHGLVLRTLPLRLLVERRLFQGPEARLRLLCEATAAGLRWTRLLTPALEGASAEGARAALPGAAPQPPPHETEPLAREATRSRPPPPPPQRAAAACPGPVAAAASLILPSVVAAAS